MGNNKQNYNGQYILKNRLKELRAEMNLSQTAFGKMVGVSKNSIISIETGRFCPTAKLALLICKALNVPDIDSCTGVMHTLFTLEDLYGFVIIEHDSQPVIKLNPNCDKYPQLHRMLLDWLKKSKCLAAELLPERNMTIGDTVTFRRTILDNIALFGYNGIGQESCPRCLITHLIVGRFAAWIKERVFLSLGIPPPGLKSGGS